MSKIENFKHFPFSLLLVLALLLLVHSQDQSGFISLDCGLRKDSNYADPSTEINYISDTPFIGGAGVSKSISTLSQVNIKEPLKTLRSFPDGIRNCYKINVKKGTKYLLRASFNYGNYDGQNKRPQFDVHLGVSFWITIKFENPSLDFTYEEIVHVPLLDYVRVCLVNTGSGIPFVSSIELRPLPNNTYEVPTGSLYLVERRNVATPSTGPGIRYPSDPYDRIWVDYLDDNWSEINTSLKVDPFSDYQPPTEVMSTAGAPKNENSSMDWIWPVSPDASAQYYFYLHYAELQNLTTNQYRAFDITLNGEPMLTTFDVPKYLVSTTIYSSLAKGGETSYTLSLVKLKNSTLPPILNAYELYQGMDFSHPETDQNDVDAITNIKSTYGLKENWDGDPCAPVEYLWEGLNCTDDSESPRIISLNLSSCELTGVITEHILNLSMLQSLDLSNNNLTGSVPDFLSQLPNLKFLNLERNQLTGVVPPELVEKSKNGGLYLSAGENSNLCTSFPCETKNKKKNNNNILVPVGASVGGLVILLLVAAAVLFGLKMRRKTGVTKANVVLKTTDDSFESNRKRQFTYAEVIKITNNFERTIGRGGFGTVFYGFTDDTQVAVKMLSPSSVQGYQQFQAEVKLLMRVHHRNLTSLVGYCNEGTNMALIYEFMANGDLGQHLSGDGNAHFASWDVRLQIATDAAQGLEYLHNGCKPPIVHRDVKTTNILLTERFQAKLSDFGLSKYFQTGDGGTHVSTIVAGTPGYLDPEYHLTSRLNEKSDVYGFGVVLLQLITSRPAISRINENGSHISQWVSAQLGNGDINSIVDPRLRGDFDTNSMWKAVEIAMACLSQSAARRPNMSIVVTELKECLIAELSRRANSRVADTTDSTNYMISPSVTTEFTPLAR